MRCARDFRLLLGCILVLSLGGAVHGEDATSAINPRYAGLPNLTDDQKAKIAAIEKQADDQVMAVLTDEQKAAMHASQTATTGAPGSGLYAAESTAKTDGPIKSRDYWQSKFNAEQLEQAIKDHQPEGAIGYALISDLQLLDDLLKQYPSHKELITWHTRAVQVQKLIGDNFDRNASFKPGCLWNQDSYMQSYVGYYTAKSAMDDKDYELAFGMTRLALQKVNYLTESDDHMADYPADAKQFVRAIKPELEQIHETTGKATHHI